MTDAIIDVVPRIHSDFIMPAIETVQASKPETTVTPPISKKEKIMFDIGNFFMKYKFYITLIIVFIIVLMYTYYYLNNKKKKEKEPPSEQPAIQALVHPELSEEIRSKESVQVPKEQYYDTSIDERITKIINQPPVTDESISQIDDKISKIITQTELPNVFDTHIDEQINNILKQDKNSSIIDKQINNLIKPENVSTFVDENVVSFVESSELDDETVDE